MNSNSNSTQTLESIFEFPPELCPDGLSLENFEECLSKYLSTMHAKGPKQPRAAISKQQKVRTAEKLCLAGSFSTETCRVSPFCEITGTGDGLNTVLLKAPAEGQGRWMFEAILCTSGVMQIGWANSSCMFNADSGVGDEPHSFGIDGKRSTFWCGKDSIDLDIDWVSGDVISSIIDISARTLTFYRNGMLVSVIDVPGISKTVKYFPAISLPKNERAIINLGDLPFMFRIKDTFTLRAEPSNTVKAKVRYVIKSLFRLIRTEENNSSGSAISPDEVAIMACQLLDCLMTVLQGEAGIDNAPALLLTELMPVINVLRSGSKGVFLTKFFELFQGAFSVNRQMNSNVLLFFFCIERVSGVVREAAHQTLFCVLEVFLCGQDNRQT